MTATFPIPNVTVLLRNGDTFETTNIDHIYNLHLELHDAYPSLTVGEFRLELVEENEEEERAVFLLIPDDTYHLQTFVQLEEMGEVWIFEITFCWWLKSHAHTAQEENEAYDSWIIPVAVDPTQKDRFYGHLNEDRDTVITWYPSLEPLLSHYPYGNYSAGTIKAIVQQIDKLIDEIDEADADDE